jgi:Transposase DNA-binding
MFPATTGPDSFAARAFPGLDLGDKRLDRRFGLVAQAALEHPEKSLPDKFHDPAGYAGCLRLLNHPAVTHDKLLSCHQVALLDRLEQRRGTVLLVHDTTELDFSGHATLAADLGQIGNGGGRGFLCHNSLAVDPGSGEVLGLAGQVLHCRPHVGKGEGVAAKRERADRESRLWLRAIDDIGPSPPDKLWVDVADRGADTFEFLQALVDRRRSFVVRSTHNRALEVGGQAEAAPHLLHDLLRAEPGQARWEVEVSAPPGRAARVARVQACARAVTLRPPHVRRGQSRREALPLWAVRVWEADPPAGEGPLEWLLLTDQPVADAGALREVVGWYERRPVIEEYHKGQKTGVGTERLQLQDAGSLRAAIALLSVVAVAIVNLRVAARDERQAEQPARRHVPELWVRVLSVWRHQEARELTVREFTLALGRMGGHLNRKSDGLPGWITLWRGWERLHTMIEYELARASCV